VRVLIAGVGLIGGSLALALRARGTHVTGHGRDATRLAAAVRAGVLDAICEDLAEGAAAADVVVLAVPVGVMRAAMAALAPGLAPGTLLTDAGSTKGSVIADARAVWGDVPANFVPAHPLAGSERSGFEHARADLFSGRRVVLTPLPDTARGALAAAHALWEEVGAIVVEMTAPAHDAALAATSHLPHLAAYALMASLARRADASALWPLAAGGLRDTTRIAGADPALWRDIALANREALRTALREYRAVLDGFDAALERGDGTALAAVFEQARAARAALSGP
jgi:prephenate dehydrogenase